MYCILTALCGDAYSSLLHVTQCGYTGLVQSFMALVKLRKFANFNDIIDKCAQSEPFLIQLCSFLFNKPYLLGVTAG